MSFYLKPPRGDIALDKLEDLALKRWKFLLLLKEHCHSINEFHEQLANHGHLSESVMENTSKDRVSHFILRLVMSKCQDYDLLAKFIDNESLLYKYRLEEMFHEDIIKSIKEVIRHLISIQESDDHLIEISKALNIILENNMLNDDGLNSKENEFKIPFQLVPKLVSKRQVDLEMGQAKINCENVIPFLHCIFSYLLKIGVHKMSETCLYGDEDDKRILILIERIKGFISVPYNIQDSNSETIKAIDIEHISSQNFPLCMQKANQHLKKHNRLGHHARIAYTLFLKEIGLSLEESLKFWSAYYSKNIKNQDTKCTHSWQENHKKFDYSIRHLYGTVGGGKNYSAHSCNSIADRSTSVNDELTCPFHDLDIEDLGQLLSQEFKANEVQVSNILKYNSHPTTACSKYLQEKKNLKEISAVEITKPSQYYMNYTKLLQ